MIRSPNHEVARMFDRISRTYDFLNHLFSFNLDRRWRNLAIRRLKLQAGYLVLDCAAGTGDMSLTAHRHVANIRTVLLDPAKSMLSLADGKAGIIAPDNFRMVCGGAESLPFADESFDRFMIAFGVRNFADLRTGLLELSRVLKTGGRGVILEFTPDRSRLIDASFRAYMRWIMGPVGAIISGDNDAYRYLSRTVQSFTTATELAACLHSAGFQQVAIHKLAFGVVTLFITEKS